MNLALLQTRIIAVSILLAAFCLALAGCSSSPDCARDEIICVGLVTDVRGLDDHGLNDSLWSALKIKDEIIANVLESSNSEDYDNNIQFFVDRSYDRIITSGYGMTDTTLAMAQANPQITFVAVDQPDLVLLTPNLITITFSEAEAGFLAGAIAAKMTHTRVIGGVFAHSEIPEIANLSRGFKRGILFIDPSIKILIDHNDNGRFKDSLDDPQWGQDTTDAFITKGADVIFAYGSTTGFAALSESSKRGISIIGFERDLVQSDPEMRGQVIASIVYEGENAIALALTDQLSINALGGRYIVIWNDAISVSEEIRAEIEAIQAKMWMGEIVP